MTPALVQDWFRALQCSATTKEHIKAVLFRLFEKAMLWEVVPVQRNPMELVEIKGASKRRKKPNVLTPEQCSQILSALREPYRTMVLVAICTGLRASEILSLKWDDFDFDNLNMRVSRSVVRGIVDRCKTETSEGELPLDETLAAGFVEIQGAVCTVCGRMDVSESTDRKAIRVELPAKGAPASRGEAGHQRSGFPHVPPHVSRMARRYWRAGWSTAAFDAPRAIEYDDEHVRRRRLDAGEATGEQRCC